MILSALLLCCTWWSLTEAAWRRDAHLVSTRALDDAESPRYVEAWAVEVSGGAESAERLAAKYGLTNRGKVSFKNGME